MKTVTFDPLTHKVVPIISTNIMDAAGLSTMPKSIFLNIESTDIASAWEYMTEAAPDFPEQPAITLPDGCSVNPAEIAEISLQPLGVLTIRLRDGTGHHVVSNAQPDATFIDGGSMAQTSITEYYRDRNRGGWANTSTQSTHQQNVSKSSSEIDTLRRDAARYRWLRDGALEGYPSSEGSSTKDAYLVITGYDALYPMNDLQKDAAIDAAMKGEKS